MYNDSYKCDHHPIYDKIEYEIYRYAEKKIIAESIYKKVIDY